MNALGGAIDNLLGGMLEPPARVCVQNRGSLDQSVERSVLLEGADEIFGVVVQTVEEKALPEFGVNSDVAS